MTTKIQSKIMSCPKCGKIPEPHKDEKTSNFEKRYSIGCENEECPFKTKVYGSFKDLSIVNWNNLVSKLRFPHLTVDAPLRSV